MNQRILELAEQASHKHHMVNLLKRYSEFDLEKFAKLIVEECMKLNSKELSITAIERLLPLYREHFGVEE